MDSYVVVNLLDTLSAVNKWIASVWKEFQGYTIGHTIGGLSGKCD